MFTSRLFLLSIIVFGFNIYYKLIFDLSEQESLYRQAVQEIYKVQAEIFDNVVNNSKQKVNKNSILRSNYTLCLERDVAKLLHDDAVVKDIYGQRDFDNGMDTCKWMIKNKFFNSNHLNKKMDVRNHTSLNKFNIFSHQNIFEKVQENCLFEKDCNFNRVNELRDKPKLAFNFRNYMKNLIEKNASSECRKYSQFIKYSYLLTDKEQCLEIFSILNSEEYKKKFEQKGLQHIVKGMGHAGSAVYILDQLQINNLNNIYSRGARCGQVQTEQMIQEYVMNPILRNVSLFLILFPQGHKAEFRLFIVQTSNYPYEAFLYKFLVIKRCQETFNTTQFSKESHLCHATSMVPFLKSYYSSAAYFDDFTAELYSQGIIDSLDWQYTHFIPQITQKFAHMIRSASKVQKDTSRWQHIALDLLIDTDLNLWFLELNTNMVLYNNYLNSTSLHYHFCENTYKLLHQKVVKRYQKLKKFINEFMIPKIKEKQPIDEQIKEKIKEALVDPPITQEEAGSQFIKIDFEDIDKKCS